MARLTLAYLDAAKLAHPGQRGEALTNQAP